MIEMNVPSVPFRISMKELWKTSNVCPTQWEGYTEDDRPFYARCRSNDVSLAIGFCGDSIDRMLGDNRLGYIFRTHIFKKKYDLNRDDLFDIFDLIGVNYDNILGINLESVEVEDTNLSEKEDETSQKCNFNPETVKYDACCNLIGVVKISDGKFRYGCDRPSVQGCWNDKSWCPIRE